jgi:hypothetical protein
VDRLVLFLDYGTPKLHIARRGEEHASWPSSSCGISRQKGRPATFWDRIDHLPTETCNRCLHAGVEFELVEEGRG